MMMASSLDVPSIQLTPADDEDSSQSSSVGGVAIMQGRMSMASSALLSVNTTNSIRSEDSEGSSSKKRKTSTEVSSSSQSNDTIRPSITAASLGFQADKIIEYQWPVMSGNYFMLQEQICDFLGIKSFKRKYPDFVRRACDVEERRYLKDSGLILEEPHMELGMTALRSDDVMELMQKEYPDKYVEYLSVLDTRHQEDYAVNVSKGYSTVSVDKSKMGEFIKKAKLSVAAYNQTLNHERREERNACMDLQSYTTHYPIGLGNENKQLIRNTAKGLVRKSTGKHPVALVPGQYQDWYIKYTSDELKYLPVNTVLYGPVTTDQTKLPPVLSSPEEESSYSVSDSSDSDSSIGDENHEECGKDTCSSSSSSCSSSVSDNEEDKDEKKQPQEDENMRGPPPLPLLMRDDKLKPNARCRTCGFSAMNKNGVIEQLVHCSDCDNSCHPSCLEFSSEMVDVIRSYHWQCSDCKSCINCHSSKDEANMMFCDKCDRGYHTNCVGLQSIPTGKWVCSLCAQCAVCGSTKPRGEEKETPIEVKKETKTTKRRSASLAKKAAQELAQKEASMKASSSSSADSWQHETIRISSGGQTISRHNLLCQPCYSNRRKPV
jgi:anti-sigma28 factor (negative regulator of flagellin synthesis)